MTHPPREPRKPDQKADAPLSQEAKDYVAKIFPCDPPCDSYGICSNCYGKVCFGAGYNFGCRAQLERVGKLLDAVREYTKKESIFCRSRVLDALKEWEAGR